MPWCRLVERRSLRHRSDPADRRTRPAPRPHIPQPPVGDWPRSGPPRPPASRRRARPVSGREIRPAARANDRDSQWIRHMDGSVGCLKRTGRFRPAMARLTHLASYAAFRRSRPRPCRPSCCPDEAQQMVDLGHQLAVGAEDFPGVFPGRPSSGREAVGLGQRLYHLRREVVAFQTHSVDATGPGGIALHQHVRRHVRAAPRFRPPTKL